VRCIPKALDRITSELTRPRESSKIVIILGEEECCVSFSSLIIVADDADDADDDKEEEDENEDENEDDDDERYVEISLVAFRIQEDDNGPTRCHQRCGPPPSGLAARVS
jgi:hypothetical protein